MNTKASEKKLSRMHVVSGSWDNPSALVSVRDIIMQFFGTREWILIDVKLLVHSDLVKAP